MKYIVKWSSSNNNGEFTISTNSTKELIEGKLKVERELGESVTILSCKKDSLIQRNYNKKNEATEDRYIPPLYDYSTSIDYSVGDYYVDYGGGHCDGGGDCGH